MALKQLKITPRPADAPPEPGEVVYQASRGGWYPPAPRPTPGAPASGQGAA